MQPLVSVIVPAFNSAWCVERTLKSIASQTYPNLEVIVVNDGSTDATASVVRSCIAGDARFRIVDQDNRGLVGARNRGIEESRGDYIAPVDADDLWHPHYVASQMAVLEKAHPEHAIRLLLFLLDRRKRQCPSGLRTGPAPPRRFHRPAARERRRQWQLRHIPPRETARSRRLRPDLEAARRAWRRGLEIVAAAHGAPPGGGQSAISGRVPADGPDRSPPIRPIRRNRCLWFSATSASSARPYRRIIIGPRGPIS